MIQALAKLLGLTPEHAEASMHSESAARAVLTRRNLFAAGAALATGSVFSFGATDPDGVYLITSWIEAPTITLPSPLLSWTDIVLTINGLEHKLPGLALIEQRITIDGFRRMMHGPFGMIVTVTEKRT